MTHYECAYGDVVLVRFDDGQIEVNDSATLPALIISSDAINEHLDTVIVCPIIEDSYISESRVGATFLPKDIIGLPQDSIVLSLQVLTVLKEQIMKRIGSLPPNILAYTRRSLKSVLNLDTLDRNPLED